MRWCRKAAAGGALRQAARDSSKTFDSVTGRDEPARARDDVTLQVGKAGSRSGLGHFLRLQATRTLGLVGAILTRG